MLGPMIQFVSVTLQCGTKINEAGLESFFWKAQVVYQRTCWPVALQWELSSQRLLHAHSTKDCFLNCNFSKLFKMVVLSFAMRDVLRWCILQPYPARQSSNGKGCGLHQWSNGDTHTINTKRIHTIPFHYSPDLHEDVGWGWIASHHCGRLWTTSILSSMLSRSLVT